MQEESLQLQTWRLRKNIEKLGAYKGSGTTLLTLLLPPGYQIAQANNTLNEEFGTAVNIKSRTTKQNVQSAITAAQQKLKLYNRVPTNGLAIYCGQVTDGHTEKRVALAFEPMKPLPSKLYICDNHFHVGGLADMLEHDDAYGFLVVSAGHALYSVVSGKKKEILCNIEVPIPKKHNKGGQSSARFGRLRLEAIHHFITKVAEQAIKCYITDDKFNVKGLIVAGSAEIKDRLVSQSFLDPRIKVITVLTVAYQGLNGLNQAIDLAEELIGNVRLVEEKKLLNIFFDNIATSSGDEVKYCFGLEDTLQALDMGAVDTLLLWDKLPTACPEDKAKEYEEDRRPDLLVEYLMFKAQDKKAKLELVSDASDLGTQFTKGFGGIGCLLRYGVVFNQETETDATADFLDFI